MKYVKIVAYLHFFTNSCYESVEKVVFLHFRVLSALNFTALGSHSGNGSVSYKAKSTSYV